MNETNSSIYLDTKASLKDGRQDRRQETTTPKFQDMENETVLDQTGGDV